MIEKKVWYVWLIGRPNSGKSSFINKLIEEKVSIVSSKPQTTRKTIRWIYNDDDSQIIFFDTPWINEWTTEFLSILRQKAFDTLMEADVIVRFVDSSRRYGEEERLIEEFLDSVGKPIIKVYSKADLATKDIKGSKDFEESIKLSLEDKDTLDRLLKEIKDKLVVWPLYYDEDFYTDQDFETRISEIIREKIFLHFNEEVPYDSFVEIWEIEDLERLIRVQAYIYCASESQKKIIIWKNAEMLSRIWREARMELEEIYGKKMFLSLRVKVMPKWKKNSKLVSNMV